LDKEASLDKKEFQSLLGDVNEIDRFKTDESDITITINLANYFSKSEGSGNRMNEKFSRPCNNSTTMEPIGWAYAHRFETE
jgi:hypothetical protein